MKDLYDAYQPCPISDASHHSTNNYVGGHLRTSSASSNSGLALLDDWMDETGYEMVKGHEVDKYLSDPFEKYIPGVDLDILLWWKLNGPLYPILSAIAKDVLAIQVSTVASESCFSTGGRIIDAKRSSLTPRIAEALICFQNWLKGNDITSFIEDEPALDLEEFYETCFWIVFEMKGETVIVKWTIQDGDIDRILLHSPGLYYKFIIMVF